MTYQDDCTLPEGLLEQLAIQGLDILPELIRIVVNQAKKLERQEHLRARPQINRTAGLHRISKLLHSKEIKNFRELQSRKSEPVLLNAFPSDYVPSSQELK
jgi:hypothetical protein